MDGALVVELAGTVQYARRRSAEADRALALAVAACRHPANAAPLRQSAARARLRAARAQAAGPGGRPRARPGDPGSGRARDAHGLTARDVADRTPGVTRPGGSACPSPARRLTAWPALDPQRPSPIPPPPAPSAPATSTSSHPRTPAASSASGRRARTSPSSPTTASTRCSTAARRPPGSRSVTALRSSSTRSSAWSPRSSTRRRSAACAGTWRSATPATPPPAAAPGRTPSRRSATTAAGSSIALGHNGNLTNTAELAVAAVSGGRVEPGSMGSTTDSDLITALLAAPPGPRPRGGGDGGAADAARRVLASSSWTSTRSTPRATRRASARWCSAGSSAAGWSPCETAALDIVGASFVREVEPGELHRHRRARAALPAVRAGPTPKGCLFEYVYLARPGHHDRRPLGARDPGRGGPPAGPRGPGRGRPGHPGAGVRHARPRSGTPRSRASPTAWAWSRTPTSAGPSSSRRRRSASSASGSSSTRCARSSRASGWSSSTTRSCAATPSGRSSGCCARPVPPRCTCGSPARRCSGRASTASTSPAGPSSSPTGWPSTRSARRSAPTRSPTSASTGLVAASRAADRAAVPACFTGDYPIELPAPDLIGKHVLEGIEQGRPAREAGSVRPVARRPGRAAQPGTRSPGSARRRARPPVTSSSYAGAGVDIDAGDRAVELMKSAVRQARRPGGGRRPGRVRRAVRRSTRTNRTAAAARLVDRRGRAPRSRIAQAMGVHDTVGIDLVAMVVDDLVVLRRRAAVPADYIACGRSCPSGSPTIVGGIAEGCRQAGCALVGGETAEHPGLLGARRVRHRRRPASGWSSATRCSARTGCAPATSLVAMASSGAALQRLLAGPARAARRRPAATLDAARRRARPGAPWARCCSTPTRIYALDCLALAATGAGLDVHAFATSPAAGWPRTWRGCCRAHRGGARPRPPGRRRRCSGWSPSAAGWSRRRWSARSTRASGWWPWSAGRQRDAALRLLAEPRGAGLGGGEVSAPPAPAQRTRSAGTRRAAPSYGRAPSGGRPARSRGSTLGDVVLVVVVVCA